MRTSRRVVITGLGVVSPIGIGKDAFWQNLIAGKSGVDYVSAFDPSPYSCQIAGEVKDFTPGDFITSRRAKMMGRFSQFALAATRLALEDAKLSITEALSQRTVICYGTSVGGLEVAVTGVEDFIERGPGVIKPWTAFEFPSHASSSYLSIEFGIKGPAVSLSSNCCTGIDTVDAAARQIASGVATAAVAGACDAPIFPAIFDAFCVAGQLTKRNAEPTKASRPYDLLRDGAILAEGGATLVLEELESALDRGARVYAEVLGYGAASEAMSMRKMDLSGKVMAGTILSAINAAGLAPKDIDHIDAHGSSVPDYDVCDTRAFKHALGDHAYRIPITSIKSMIGHPVSAASALQVAAACLSIQHQLIPPTINQEFSDPECDLDYTPNACRVARVRHALVNAHSNGGSVAALVIGHLAC